MNHFLLFVLLFTLSVFAAPQKGTLKDSRDGQVYKTVKIGDQVWMAENLNLKMNDSFCYDDNPEKCRKYGRYYKWNAALKACPNGWRLPSKSDFEELFKNPCSGLRTKNGWDEDERGTDIYGFSWTPVPSLVNYGGYGRFWTSTDYEKNEAFSAGYYFGCFLSATPKGGAESIRCIKEDLSQNEKKSSMKDLRDGQIYKTVSIGNQTWMAENLNVKTGGDLCYDNKSDNCKKYGRLYTFEDALKACPAGWHLPSRGEFERLFNAVGGRSMAGKKLKSSYGWNKNGGGVDGFGLNVLPAGHKEYSGFYGLGNFAKFWTSSEYIGEDEGAYFDEQEILYMGSSQNNADFQRSEMFKSSYFSIRCVKNRNDDADLEYAVMMAKKKAVDSLLVRLKNDGAASSFTTAVLAAVKSENVELLKLLFDAGASLENCSENNYSPLYLAVRMRKYKALKYLIEKGVNVNATCGLDYTILDWCYTIAREERDVCSFCIALKQARGRFSDLYNNDFSDFSACKEESLVTTDEKQAESESSAVFDNEQRVTSATSGVGQEEGVSDLHDVQTYKTVKIGSQVWMAENLNVEISGSWCYDDKPENCEKYGRLYDWNAAQKACPSGWRLPSKEDIELLFSAVGGKDIAGRRLKSKKMWDEDLNGDVYSFSALPAGRRDITGSYTGEGKFAYFWSSTAEDEYFKYSMFFEQNSEIGRRLKRGRYLGYSVRCVKN